MVNLSQLDAEINQTCHSKKIRPLADTRTKLTKDQRYFVGVFKDEDCILYSAEFMEPLSAESCSLIAVVGKTCHFRLVL